MVDLSGNVLELSVIVDKILTLLPYVAAKVEKIIHGERIKQKEETTNNRLEKKINTRELMD